MTSRLSSFGSIALSLFVAAGCNKAADSGADDLPDVMEATSDAPVPVAAPQVLVPKALGRVVDFAYSDDWVYPIVNLGGSFKLVACPRATGCGAAPNVIGRASTAARGQGVEVAGNKIYWVVDDTTLAQATLDGSTVGERHHFFGAGKIVPHLRGTAGALYLDYNSFDAPAHTVTLSFDTATTAPPKEIAGTKTSDVSFATSVDAGAGVLAVWRQAASGARPIQIIDVASGPVGTGGASSEISLGGLAVGSTRLFYVDGDTSSNLSEFPLYACPLTGTCTSPARIATASRRTIAAHGDRVYFAGRDPASNRSTILSCDLAASTSCMPKAIVMPETDFDFLNVLALRADASAVWVATDVGGEGTLWRIPL